MTLSNNTKIGIIIIVVIFLGFLIVQSDYFQYSETSGLDPDQSARRYVNLSIPEGFQFTSSKEEIPKDYILKPDYASISMEGEMFQRKFFCKDLNREPEILEYFSHNSGGGQVGGWGSRFAVVCGNEYLIVSQASHLGEVAYGPFRLDQASVKDVPKEAPIVAENPEGEADPARMTLRMKDWVWIKTTYNDGREIKPASGKPFVLIFNDNNTFSLKTDCNGVGGKYAVSGNNITFNEMISTLMYCEGSLETEFSGMLGDTQGYHFTSRGELVLDLKFDSGSVVLR